MTSRGKQVTLCKPKALTVAGVLKTLKDIATTSGNEAMKRKKDKIKGMLVAAQEKEAQVCMPAPGGQPPISPQSAPNQLPISPQRAPNESQGARPTRGPPMM